MFKFNRDHLGLFLVGALVLSVSIGHNPACSAAALGLLFAYTIVDRYFKDTFFDENRQAIARLREDFAKVKGIQDQQILGNALGGKRG